MGKLLGALAMCTAACVAAQDGPALEKFGVDPRLRQGGVYRGRFAPDADYVLDGKLARDFKLPPMPYRFLTEEDGYRPELSEVPAPGVHPRVLMSPSDIEALKKKVALGDGADRYFRLVWNDIRTKSQSGDILCMALEALCTDNRELGRRAAEKLVAEAEFKEPMVDLMNTHPRMEPIRDSWYYYARMSVKKVGGVFYRDAYEKGGAELIQSLAKQSVEFASDSDRQSSGGLFNTPIMFYDYVYPYMTDAERSIVRRVIAKLTNNRYTAGMGLPGNMFINNHMSMGEDLLLLSLAIEGEEGYEPRILEQYAPAVNHKIIYDVSLGGHLHEKCKGFLPERAVLAITRRASPRGGQGGGDSRGPEPLLSNDHLMQMVWAKVMDSANLYSGTADDLGELTASPRRWWMGYGSGPWMDQFFNWAFLLKFAYPESEVVDYFYKERLMDMKFGDCDLDPQAEIPKPRIRYTHRDVMLLTVTDGLRDKDGKVINYNKAGLPREVLNRRDAWVDLPRGVAMSRSSWDRDALFVHYECRSDVYSAGHETPEAGDFNLFSHGIGWSLRRDWYMDCYFRNMVLIDGYAGVYSPVCGKLMKVEDNSAATTFLSDQTDQYNWRKIEKNLYSWHNMLPENPWEAERWPGGRWGRDWEVPFQKHMREYHEGLAGLDWGNWHGETRGPEMYQRWNEVDHVFRTLHMTKGENPYILVIDDVRRDDKQHQYDWLLHLERDVTLFKADSSVRGRYLQKGMPKDRTTDLILCLRDAPERRYDSYGIRCHREPKKGDPLLLVRVLWRNSQFPYPQPAFEEGAAGGWPSLGARVRVPATTVAPEFRVLLFPYRHGETLPVTQWSEDRTELTVSVGGNTDVYTFGKTDRERTVFTMTRNGKPVTSTPYGPAMPQLDTPFGWTPDRNLDGEVRNILISGESTVRLKDAPLGSEIRYTLQPPSSAESGVAGQSDPTDQSDLYTGPIAVNRSCTLKAKTFARYWPHRKDNGSETLVVRLEKQALAKPLTTDSGKRTARGLTCEVFELRRSIFDDRTGIFTGKTNMLPPLEKERPILACRTAGFAIPEAKPQTPAVEMEKGFFRYRGYFRAEADGVYGFKVNSCGPVALTLAGHDVVRVTGVYGLSQKDRYGQAVLKAGLHTVELIVCDPVFWKAGREGPYAIDVAVMPPGTTEYATIPGDLLSTDKTGLRFQEPPEPPRGRSVKVVDTVPGLVMNCYDRIAMNANIPYNGLDPKHLEVGTGEKPYRSEPVLGLESSDNAGRLVEYTGYMIADVDGVYEFQLDRGGGNQLLIDGTEIARNRTTVGTLPGRIRLDQGMHTFSLRLAESGPAIMVKRPGHSDFEAAGIGMFARPKAAEAFDDGRIICLLDGEALNGELLDAQVKGVKAILRKGMQTEGRTGKGMKLGGDDSMIIVQGLSAPENAFSIAFWIRFDEILDRGLVESSWGSHPGARLRHTSVWADYFRGSERAAFDLRVLGARDKEKKWIHVAITWGAEVRIYANGELRASGVKNVPARHAHVTELVLFKDQAFTVDDVILVNKELSSDDVMRIFQQ